jgi:transcriptional regulator with XRE-family HTH domain
LSFLFRSLVVPSARNLYRIVGNAVRAQRKRARLSQEQLAEKADLTRNYIGEIERGEKKVTLDTLARVAKALKIRVAELTRDI